MKKPVSEKQALINRARTVGVLLSLLAVAVMARLVWIQYVAVYKGKTWAQRAAESSARIDTIPAMRGNIHAADGSLLATSLPYYHVGIDPTVAGSEYFERHLDELASLFASRYGERSASYYSRKIRAARAARREYVPLLRRPVSYLEMQKIETWPFFTKGDRRGGVFDSSYRRYRPFSPMADRTVGTVNPATGRGRVGLEASFDKQLSGRNGVSWVQVLPHGVRLPVPDEFNIRPEPGHDIHTTLDVNFQDVAEASLKKTLLEFQANYGCVIVMEVSTGKIRAMSNLTRRGNRIVDDRNYALTMGVDPGSTFKLATIMAILEETKIDPDQVWVDTGKGRLVYRGLAINDAHRGGFGSLTASQVLEKSSNIGTHLLMRRYFYDQPDKYLSYLEKFRLKNRTGIHMAGESAPFIRDRTSKLWSKTSLTPMSYGYDMRLAPIQILALYNAVANNGYWVRPMIVEEVRSSSEIVNTYEPYVTSSPICSQRTVRLVQRMLEGVVLRGTAPALKDGPYRVAGKTGTAQKIINGAYVARKGLRTSFVGYFPADRPKYSCLVLVDNSLGGGSDLYAGTVAAPVFKEVADRIYAYDLSLHEPAQLVPDAPVRAVTWAGSADEAKVVASTLNLTPPPVDEATAPADQWLLGSTAAKGKTQWKARPLDKADVPDLRGLALRDALYIMENRGFRVVFKGVGKVVSQSPAPGAKVPERKVVNLSLE